MAFDATFQHPIPGSSIAYKWGSFPFSRPPQHVDPNEALEKIWKLLHVKTTLKQLWYLLEKGANVHDIAKAIVYKASIEGVIQINLATNILPTVMVMILTIAKAKGINPKIAPKVKDPIKDAMGNDNLNQLMGNKISFPYPKSALDSMPIPKPEDAKALYVAKQKQLALKQRAQELSQNIQQNKQAVQPAGLLNMSPNEVK